jgi:hypothetical protein
MEAVAALTGHHEVTLHHMRTHVGAEVSLETVAGTIVGTLLSCTSRSAWLVAADVDHVVALPNVLSITRR